VETGRLADCDRRLTLWHETPAQSAVCLVSNVDGFKSVKVLVAIAVGRVWGGKFGPRSGHNKAAPRRG